MYADLAIHTEIQLIKIELVKDINVGGERRKSDVSSVPECLSQS